MRHTLDSPFSAAFEYLDDAGREQIATEATGPGRAHPGELLWRRLEREGVAAERVRRVYREPEPCTTPGHYCAAWVHRVFFTAELRAP
ncbi:nucleic acid/nucleotide deaminase domain-containing protein [Streptomyces viridosporus]|uniref:nucleic acid/nucleotide deaminase domain-containing protein n=1 Tax=Streptomyces viridosporus TaxID=67581 RepID=UPI0009C15D2C|nr:nucleic acid/nucleotide deaminase domain-containing protein [Streptomyces viridosporus]